MSELAQKMDESNLDWLKRLTAIGAPVDLLASVRALIESETRKNRKP